VSIWGISALEGVAAAAARRKKHTQGLDSRGENGMNPSAPWYHHRLIFGRRML
jgi:hypothetical protein